VIRRGAIVLLLAAALVGTGAIDRGGAGGPVASGAAVTQPNIVFILTDDLSWDLVTERFAPHLVALARRGVTFDRYFVADSLCCPSRSTIFTGRFPHNTKVVRNQPPAGGFQKFQAEHLDRKTFAVKLQAAGYATSMLGKYLNGYGDPMVPATAPIPPGWSDWHVSNSTGYQEFDFLLNDNGTVNTYRGPEHYGVDVLNEKAQSFITRHAARPFAIEIATFAPHAPYTPAPRNAADFPGLRAPRDPSFDRDNVNPPAWLGRHPPFPPRQLERIDTAFRKRAQAVESVDRLLADTEATLARHHLTDRTYIVFSSDNGYHLGQHRLPKGKQTAFDTDIRVPLIVAGPGVPHHRVASQVAQNVDLYPTFTELAGTAPGHSVDGRSLVPLLRAESAAPRWRTVALVEHQHDDTPTDPDFEGARSNPTTYDAIRIVDGRLRGFADPVDAVYVEYRDPQHEIEYYDLKTDPYERRNLARRLTPQQRAALHRVLTGLVGCRGASTCWPAALPR
jgi:N-acetylglucosamine-6-sulfatase